MADERPPLPDFYAVLGIGFDATNDELRQAWRTAVKQWHPDTNRSPEAHGMMTRINEAWEVLGDPERRAEYDTLYFTLRAAIANEERKLREEERLERQRQERIRQQERERQRRVEEAARKRAEVEEQRRKEQARKERERREEEARRKAEREQREKERKEREQRERERRAAEARRKAELERKRREQERINREREEQERAERLRRQREAEERDSQERNREPGMPSGPPGGTANGRGRGGSGGGRAAWGLAFVGLAALIVVAGVFIANRIEEQNVSDRAVARVVPTVRLHHTPTPRPTPVPTATPTPTTVPTATPTATPAPTPMPTVTPIPAIIYVTATPTVTPDPDLDWVEYIEPGSVHEYLLLSDNPTGADVRRMIEAGAEFGYIDDIGFGSLFMAVVTGAGADVVTALLDAGDDLEGNPQMLHALMWSDNATVEVARVLLDAGADVLHRDHNGQTPLDIAIVRIEVPQDVYEVIVEATEAAREQVRVAATPTAIPTATAVPTVTATPTPTSVPTDTPVPTPSATPEPTATATPTVEPSPTSTPTPSPTATSTPVPNEVATKSLWQALKRAVRPDRDEVSYIISLGADITDVDTNGLTMFEYAFFRGYSSSVVGLLSADLSVEAATRSLWFILTQNLSPPRSRVEFLVDLGADVSVSDSRGRTMFEYAVGRGFDVEVLQLLEAGVRVRHPAPTSTATPTPRSSQELILRGSGTIYAEHDDGSIDCPADSSEPAFLATDAISGEVSFSFGVPSVSSWSIGLVYHDIPDDTWTLTATFLHRPPNAPVEAWHITRVGQEIVDKVDPVVVSPLVIDQSYGALNTVTIATGRLGSRLVVNNADVLVVPNSELRAVRGSMQVCVGIRKVEQEDYQIDYFDLRAWSQ